MRWQEALSGISGSISLAAWIFLLVPQLIENYQHGSAEGISLTFLTVWLIGDLTNFLGAVWAGLVPTVIALAVYFCFADLVLITQCLYYNVIQARTRDQQRQLLANDSIHPILDDAERPLLERQISDIGLPGSRRRSSASRSLRANDATALVEDTQEDAPKESRSTLASALSNLFVVLCICAVGIVGWVIAWKTELWTPSPEDDDKDSPADMVAGAQILGYLSAFCYLGARIPQIVKNYRERSCQGLSLLFFILSVLGNATYGAGILFHSVRKDYVIKNLPWLIGSLGTMAEDVVIFVQFHQYGDQSEVAGDSAVS